MKEGLLICWSRRVCASASCVGGLQALFEAMGLVGKPAHQPARETPYPVEELGSTAPRDEAFEGVVVTHTRGQGGAAQAHA